MRTRCLDCRAWATHRGRCEDHYRAYEAARSNRSHRKRREAIARGSNAAAILRAMVNRAGQATCARCGRVVLASAVDVDHVTPLARGGEDEPANVQALCKPCHKVKTRADFGHKTPPF